MIFALIFSTIKFMLYNLWAHFSYFLADFEFYLILLAVSFISTIIIIFKIYKSQWQESKKKLWMTVFFSVLLLILALCFFEAFFRYRYDESDGLGFLDTNVRWYARHVVYNTYGFRDRDFSIKKASGVIRIGVIGDSLTMGQGIMNVDDRYSNLLEKKFLEKGFQVQVYNLGISGLDTCSEIKLFDRVKQLNFDIMVWEYYPNDIQPCEKSTGTKILVSRYTHLNPAISFFRKKSFFFDFLYWRFSTEHVRTYTDLKNADMAQYGNPPVFNQHLKDIASFSAQLQNNTTSHKVVVIFFPFLFLLDKEYPKILRVWLDPYFIKQGNILIDIREDLVKMDRTGKSLMVNRFDSHPNEKVNRLAADRLYDMILPIVKNITENNK